MKTKIEICECCQEKTKRQFFTDVDGKEHSSLIRHLKNGMPCIKGSLNLMDLMSGKQYTGEKSNV